MSKKLVPDSFVVPDILEADRFRLRMLSEKDAELDYDAVMSGWERLTHVFAAEDDWPAEDMTVEDNLADLRRHQQEFLNRVAFAYTVMNPDETECLGCVYLKPTRKHSYDVEVYLWVRQSEFESGRDEELYALIKAWVKECWPFLNPAYPGRDISWEKWE